MRLVPDRKLVRMAFRQSRRTGKPRPCVVLWRQHGAKVPSSRGPFAFSAPISLCSPGGRVTPRYGVFSGSVKILVKATSFCLTKPQMDGGFGISISRNSAIPDRPHRHAGIGETPYGPPRRDAAWVPRNLLDMGNGADGHPY